MEGQGRNSGVAAAAAPFGILKKSGVGVGRGVSGGSGIGLMGGMNAESEGVGVGVGGDADFTSLLSSSTSLLSSWNTANQTSAASSGSASSVGVGRTGGVNASLKKNMRELGVASASLGVPRRTKATAPPTGTAATAPTAAAATYEAEASAHRLLAREGGGFDSAHLGRSARELELRANATATAVGNIPKPYSQTAPSAAADGPAAIGTGGGSSIPYAHAAATPHSAAAHIAAPYADARDVNHILNASYSNLMKDVLYTQRQNTTQHAHSLIHGKLIQDFNIEKQYLLKDLVHHRTLGGASSAAAAEQRTAAHHAAAFNAPQAHSTTQLSHSALQHANIVAALPPRSHPHTPAQTIQHLLSVLPHSSPDSNTADEAYANACNMLHSIIDTTHNTSSISTTTIASLSHLANQYRNHILTMVHKAAMAGRLNNANQPLPPTDTASGVAKHVHLFVKLNTPPPAHTNNALAAYHRATLWAALYYCLRCGDACAALITLQNVPSNINIEPSITSLVTQLSNYQSSHDAKSIFFTPSSSSSSLASIVSLQNRMEVVELYHTVKTRFTSSTNNDGSVEDEQVKDMEHMFQLASLALLSLAEPLTSSSSSNTTSPASNVVQTIEDYLFASLWMAVHQSPSSACEDDIINLGQLLKHWGPAYFEGTDDNNTSPSTPSSSVPSSGGWAYTFPLLLSQQYHTALSHLAEVGGGTGLLQATHLALIMYHAGIPLYDLKPFVVQEGEEHKEGEERRYGSNEEELTGKKLLAKLIVSYTSAFQNVDPRTALEYLVRLPDIHDSLSLSSSSSNNNMGVIGQFAKKQIRRLLLETRAFEPLAGKVSSDGSRQSAVDTTTTTSPSGQQIMSSPTTPALDVYFSSTEVSSMLADAAVDTMREGNKADAAELFALAGKYGSLLSLLNRELASHLVDDDHDAATSMGGMGRSGTQLQQKQESQERSFWRNAALHFHSIHLAHGRTHVVEVLEKEGNLALGDTFQLLMNLMVFFDRCRDQKWEDAWLVIDSLPLLPRTEAEMSRKVEAFHCLDSVLQHSFHHIALASMECLYHQHTNLKSTLGRGQSASAAGATEQRLMELRGRGRLLVTFAGLIQMRSSADTNAKIARMEAYMM